MLGNKESGIKTLNNLDNVIKIPTLYLSANTSLDICYVHFNTLFPEDLVNASYIKKKSDTSSTPDNIQH